MVGRFKMLPPHVLVHNISVSEHTCLNSNKTALKRETHIHIDIQTYIRIYIYIHICVCVTSINDNYVINLPELSDISYPQGLKKIDLYLRKIKIILILINC